MKTVTIPFDLEIAKKIQNGEVEGRIVNKAGTEFEIVKWNAKGDYPIIGIFFNEETGISQGLSFTNKGKYIKDRVLDIDDLELEVPEYLTWKEGDYLTIKHNEKTYIIIYKTYTVTEGNHPINYHVLYNVSRGELFFNECATKFLDITPSTPFDIAKLTDALLKEGKRWNPETKQVEDVEKKPEHVFKPFDKVLVKDSDTDIWICDIFSHMDDDNAFYCVRGIWNYCIPYEGNEHLVGKTGNSEEHED